MVELRNVRDADQVFAWVLALFVWGTAGAGCSLSPVGLSSNSDAGGGAGVIDAGHGAGASAASSLGATGGSFGVSGVSGNSTAGGASVPAPSPSYTVVTCSGVEVRPNARSGCSSVGDPAFGLLIRGDILQKAQVLRGGELGIDATGLITCTDCTCAGDSRALVIDCPDSVVSPGLINLHDHLSYANNAPSIDTAATSERYDDRAEWRLGLRSHTKIDYSGSASSAAVLAQEFRMLLSGVTSIAGGAGQPGLVRNLDVPGLSEGLLVGQIDSDTFPLADTDGVGNTGDCSYSEARMTSASVAKTSAYLPHLSEGIDAFSQNELICSETGVFGLLGPHTAVVHAVAISAPEARALADSRSWVIWSPRSNLSLYGNTTPVTLLKRLGVGIALGSDWLLSGSMNLSRELECARSLSTSAFDGAFSDFDLFRMVTSNAARAVGVGRGLGALEPGYTADVAIFAKHGLSDHSAVVQAQPADVELVLRGGRPLYGDEALVQAFGTLDCEAFDVCDTPKATCLLADAGITLSALRVAGEAIYPLFSCGTPPDEPSCVPTRPGEYAPQSSVDDRDGDGIPDANDLCPDVFDPIRPLDRGAQADYDADGIGDACDPCPLAAGPCPSPPLFDRDGDGIDDAHDNCPEDANPDQLDSDGDQQGDACDPCPAPNPGLSPCSVSVSRLVDPESIPRIPIGTAVVIEHVYVTALRPPGPSSQGFFVQDTSLHPYSGVSVYSGDLTLGVRVGQRVTVRGYLSEFEGAAQLNEPSVAVEADSANLPFGAVAVADPASLADGGALAEAYRSMWVTLASPSVLTENPDAPADFDEFVVTGGLRIDDALYPDLDNTFPVGTSFRSLSGILGYSFAHPKLWPRSSADIAQ
jgi:cytosine/adenosine deaminase-related metal-dependent hydrolase